MIEYVKDWLARDKTFIDNPRSHLVAECDKQSKEVRNNLSMNLINELIEYYGSSAK